LTDTFELIAWGPAPYPIANGFFSSDAPIVIAALRAALRHINVSPPAETILPDRQILMRTLHRTEALRKAEADTLHAEIQALKAEKQTLLSALRDAESWKPAYSAQRAWADHIIADRKYLATLQKDAISRLEHHNQSLIALQNQLDIRPSLARRLARALRPPISPTLPMAALLTPYPPLPDIPEAPPDSHRVPLPQPDAGTTNILFIAGEPDTPGATYRCNRLADAAQAAGYSTRIKACADVGVDDLQWATIASLWRVEFSGHVDILLTLAKEYGVTTIFDTDDLVFLPHLARMDIIDGIRSIGATEHRIEQVFTDMRRTMQRCALCVTTTEELAHALRPYQPLTHVLPNSFDIPAHTCSRLHFRMHTPEDALIRIGYATGSRTHQRDFAPIAPALAEVLRLRPQARLVLFKDATHGNPVLLTDEFPALRGLEHQIEWRMLVPLAELPAELARFDISIAPLQTGNVFCEAKSEIKFSESALVNTPLIASPTGPFRRAIQHGLTGFLADTQQEWTKALLTLIDNPALRQQIGRNAYHATLWRFGPQAQTQRMRTILNGLTGEHAATLAGETLLARNARTDASIPTIPDSECLFHRDVLGEATVSVVVTSYNYARYVLDALDSVHDQTLALIDLIVVDDASTDDSTALILAWMRAHETRFNRLILLRATHNTGLGGARNIGMNAVETLHAMQLDADNRLLPDACTRLSDAMSENTAFAYPQLQAFDEQGNILPDRPLMGDFPYHPLTLVGGNHIDAMAMIAKWAWAAAGGYYVSKDTMGWEDYDLWCSFAERGLPGTHISEPLAQYRIHNTSMTNAVTERSTHKARVVQFVQSRHPWIRLVAEDARPRI